MKTTLQRFFAALLLPLFAISLAACDDAEPAENGFDAESAKQAAYEHAMEETSKFGISDTVELCDIYASGDEDQWRQRVTNSVPDVEGYKYKWANDMFQGIWEGYVDFCKSHEGYK